MALTITLPGDSLNDLPLLANTVLESSAKPSEIEREVVRLFEQFRDPVLRYVLSIGLPVQDAEEITQEVFLALLQHLRLGRSRQRESGWIFRVAHNLALKRRDANRWLVGATTSDSSEAEMHPDPSSNPEEQASFTQRRRRLLAVLRALPEDDQYCLRLRAEGLRYREIAEVLGVSLGSVSLSLARSLTRLTRAEGVKTYVKTEFSPD
jgi:RNA polymerase sigma-70 factor, ECF subfamily